LRRKTRFEEMKDFRVEKKVFDDRTLLAIYKLMNRGFVKSVESMLKEGKESLVLSGKDNEGRWVALKVYRVEHSDFNGMWKYLVSDPRFRNVKKEKRFVVYTWCRREFANLNTAYKAGVLCPRPIAFFENVLVSEMVGEGGALPPMLSDLKFSQKDAQWLYDLIIDQVYKIFEAGLVHTDLSAYNILFFEKPYIIDFSQAVPLRHPQAKEFLLRDFNNINSYFSRLGAKVKNSGELLTDLASKGGFR
jgi:RIO kinase 1